MRLARRLIHALLIVLTLVIGAAAAAIIVSQTAWFRDWLRGYIVREARQYLNGQLSIERLGGNLFFGIEMKNIGLSMDGSQVVAVKDLGLDYNVFELVSRGLSIKKIRLNEPVLYLRREGDAWSISRLIKKQAQEADRQGPINPITVDDISITGGSVVIQGPVGASGVDVPKRFDQVDARMSFNYEPVRYSMAITQASFRGSEPAIRLNQLSGGVSVRDDTLFLNKLSLRTQESTLAIDGAVQSYLTRPVLNVQISSDRLSLPEIARLVPAVADVGLQPAFELHLSGSADRVGVGLNVRSSAGAATADVVADLIAPGQSVIGDISVRRLDLAPILNKPGQTSDITASAHVDLHAAGPSDLDSLSGSVRLDAPRIVVAGLTAGQTRVDAHIQGRRVDIDARAAAYGITTTAAGRITLTDGRRALSYDVRGRAQHVDLDRLPRELNLPAAPSDVNADYHVAGTVPASGAGLTIRGALEFLESSIAGARIARFSTAGFSLDGKQIGYQADATVADLDLEKIGEAFGVRALATGRFKSSINGQITASGQGTKPEAMTLTANGTLAESSIFGGRIPRLTFDAGLVSNTAHVKANGELEGFDPSAITGTPALKGEVGATVDVDATLNGISSGVSPDSVQATARITLQPSMIGGLAIDSASIDGDYRDSTGVIRALEVKGRDITVSAAGTLALGETGQSNVTFRADTPSLVEIGKLVDQPLRGSITVDGTLTGNRRELEASGQLVGGTVAYGDISALTVSTDYTVKVPDLAPAQARISADTAATFLAGAGQNINEVHAKTQYANHEVNFDATASQPQRSLGAAGLLLLSPADPEVRLQQLSLQAQGASWQLAPGSAPAIHYGGNAVVVDDLKLVSGNQQIAADGAFGHPGDALKVSLDNVDLDGVDRLMLRPSQFTGRLSAASTITGTKDAPRVNAELQINQGGFRQFHYDTLQGTADYSGKGITLDAKLQQNPTTSLTVKGYVPVALFIAPSGDEATVASDNRIDLHIESSPIDLGLVQGFTTALTKVSGTLQAKVDIGGSAGDPRPTGAIAVQNGAFTVGPTGVSYSGLDAHIDLEPDRVHIADVSVLDNRRKALSVSGDLALHELQVGGVNLSVKADDFKVVDNKMGSVRVRTDLRVAGELGQPRIEGDLRVMAGTINLDPILAATSESAYATRPADYVTAAAASGNSRQDRGSIFETLQLDVHVTAANDLVVRGSDLQAGDSPVGLGSLNLTLGGDLWASKAPYDQLRLTGTVNTVRGTYQFQGRRFDILRDGRVRFDGLDEIDPALDIKTQRVIQAVTATVNIRGRLSKPEIVLSSTPPLEEADILALIVFNQSINQLGEGQQISLGQRAQALATGAVASQLATSIGNTLGVDLFEISTAPESGAAAEITVGQQVGQNLYVKLQQGVGDQSQTNFILEYELARWLRLRTNVLQGSSTQQQLFQRAQGSGADLIFFFTY
jgi:autotransporter translocation and assembly factor TamB